jgi:outer membrane murein-binding lipoprotein Lpp
VAQLFSLGSIHTPQQIHIMKLQVVSLLCIIIVGTALLCGCHQKPDPKIAELESQVKTLSEEIDKLASATSRLGTNISVNLDFLDAVYNVQTNLSNQIDDQQLDISAMKGRLANLETLAPNQITRPAAASVQRYAPGQMPASVAAQIRADAAARFPNDYDEQVYIIKQQADAWYKLHQ